MAKFETLNIADKKVFLIEFSSDLDQEIAVMHKAREIIASEPEKSVRIITDVSNANYDPKAIQELKEYTKHNNPYIKYSAIVGLKGMKKVFLWSIIKITGRKFFLFNTLEEAKDWIVKQP